MGDGTDDVRVDLVWTLCADGRFAEAHELADDGFVERNGSFGYLVRARIFAYERRGTESREAVDWALAHAEPGDSDAPVLAGLVLLMLGDAYAALAVGARAAHAAPGDWRLQVLVSDAYRSMSRTDESAAAARRAVALAPDEAEAHLALGRALAEYRTMVGRPKKYRQQQQEAFRRAAELGADAERFNHPRGGLSFVPGLVVLAGVAVAANTGVGPWAIGGVVVVLAALCGVLWFVQSGWSGTSSVSRLQAMRAFARAELADDGAKARLKAWEMTFFLPGLPFLATGFLTAAGSGGHPWPAWAGVPAAAGATLLPAGLALVLRWWYGGPLLRAESLCSRLVRFHLTVVCLLVGVSAGLSMAGMASRAAWTALFAAQFVWFFAGGLGTAVVLGRERRQERAAGA
jgi:tetratricopeptide (TPR) repeat protein